MREPIHPGETLREDLDALGMSAAELARRIQVPVNRITRILNGRRAVTGDTALRLGRFFGTSGEFWLNLQKLYELRLAERENGAAIARLPTLDRARRRAAKTAARHERGSPKMARAVQGDHLIDGDAIANLGWRQGSSFCLRREPSAQRSGEVDEGRVVTISEIHRCREIVKPARRPPSLLRESRLFHCPPHRVLRVLRFTSMRSPQILRFQPSSKGLEIGIPPQNLRYYWRATPYPSLKLGIDNDGLGPAFPTVACQPDLDFFLDLLTRPPTSTTVTVEYNQCVTIRPRIRPQEIGGVGPASAIPVDVSPDFEVHGCDVDAASADEEALHCLLDICVGDEHK